jgi:hypothetical protein
MGFTSDLEGETVDGPDRAICACQIPTEASRAVISGLFPDSGKNLPIRHYIFRGDDATAPKAWARCETMEACLAPCRQCCRERMHRSRNPARAVVWMLMWTQGSR